jgi:hypothetical protein
VARTPQTMIAKTLGTLAALSTLTAAILLFVLGASIDKLSGPASGLAFASACSQLLSLAILLYQIWRVLNRVSNVRDQLPGQAGQVNSRIQIFLGGLATTTAGAASIAAGVWVYVLFASEQNASSERQPLALLFASLVVSIISTLAQLAFYVALLTCKAPALFHISEPIPLSEDRPDVTELSRPETSQTLHASPPPSSQVSQKNSSIGSSLRSSLTITVRPATSKTKLISRQQQSYPVSINTARDSTDSAFDSWDTSSISPQLRETVIRSSPIVSRGPLSPIPGSRSPSPAKALEGPFITESAPSTARPSTAGSQPSSPPHFTTNFNSSHSHFTSMSQPSSPVSSRAFIPTSFPNHSRTSVFRGRSSTESLPHYARARSASNTGSPGRMIGEEHIHPLFRSSSPTPPPSATPGTTVTAAPGSFAGLLINERMIRRMRSGSAPNSPSPLGTGTGFFFPERGLGIEDEEESEDENGIDQEQKEHSENEETNMISQEGRKMTPPIPEFILATGSADRSDYERRQSEARSGNG